MSVGGAYPPTSNVAPHPRTPLSLVAGQRYRPLLPAYQATPPGQNSSSQDARATSDVSHGHSRLHSARGVDPESGGSNPDARMHQCLLEKPEPPPLAHRRSLFLLLDTVLPHV